MTAFIPLSFLMLWYFSPRVWSFIFCGIDERRCCAQREFHFCYAFFLFFFICFLALSAFFFFSLCCPLWLLVSFLGSLNCVVYNFRGFWSHSVSRVYLSVVWFLPSFLLGCLALLLFHRYRDGCLCLLFVLAWDQFWLPKKSVEKSSSTPLFSSETCLNGHLRTRCWWVVMVEAVRVFQSASWIWGKKELSKASWDILSPKCLPWTLLNPLPSRGKGIPFELPYFH